MSRTEPEIWRVEQDGVTHAVQVGEKGLRREITWSVDGTVVATQRTSDQRVRLSAEEYGAIEVRLPAFTGPARRVSLHGSQTAALTGVGGTDLDPAPGTAAARREAWIRDHPRQHAARRGAVAAAGVLLPLLLILLLPRLPLPDIDLPLPNWNMPDLPFPDIPFPDIPRFSWSAPAWLREVLSWLKYVFPVLVAVGVAVAEVRRRQQQDEAKAQVPGQGQDQGRDSAARTAPRPASTSANEVDSGDSPTRRPPGSR